MTSKELKAMAYDVMANIDFLKNKLNEINQAIAKAVKEEKDKENGSTNNNSAN